MIPWRPGWQAFYWILDPDVWFYAGLLVTGASVVVGSHLLLEVAIRLSLC